MLRLTFVIQVLQDQQERLQCDFDQELEHACKKRDQRRREWEERDREQDSRHQFRENRVTDDNLEYPCPDATLETDEKENNFVDNE